VGRSIERRCGRPPGGGDPGHGGRQMNEERPGSWRSWPPGPPSAPSAPGAGPHPGGLRVGDPDADLMLVGRPRATTRTSRVSPSSGRRASCSTACWPTSGGSGPRSTSPTCSSAGPRATATRCSRRSTPAPTTCAASSPWWIRGWCSPWATSPPACSSSATWASAACAARCTRGGTATDPHPPPGGGAAQRRPPAEQIKADFALAQKALAEQPALADPAAEQLGLFG